MAVALRHAWRRNASCAWPVLSAGAGGAVSRMPGRASLRLGGLGAYGVVERSGVRSLATGAGTSPSVPAALVKELRGRTGASMGKCRTALAEEDGDLEKAVDWLRKRGIRSMERRTNETDESLLAVCTKAGAGAIVEIKAETDFVTKNDLFQEFTISVASIAAVRATASEGNGLGDAACSTALSTKFSDGATVQDALLELGSVLGERLALGQHQQLQASPSGVVAGYAHPKFTGAVPGTGRMAALVSVRPSPAGSEEETGTGLHRIASQLARHVVALQPRFVSVESVPADVLEKERNTLREAHMQTLDDKRKKNLDEAVLTKILDGKTNKFFQESVLLRQELTVPNSGGSGEADPKPVSVEKWLQQEAKSMGLDAITLDGFRLIVL